MPRHMAPADRGSPMLTVWRRRWKRRSGRVVCSSSSSLWIIRKIPASWSRNWRVSPGGPTKETRRHSTSSLKEEDPPSEAGDHRHRGQRQPEHWAKDGEHQLGDTIDLAFGGGEEMPSSS